MGRARRGGAGAVIVGVISDTHGLLRPEAVAALRGVALIVHAGDIGSATILEALRRAAPVVAVRGNNDREPWASSLPEILVEEVAGARLCVVHDVKQLRIDPGDERLDVVVSGHSHRPGIERRGPVLFLNPGSAGPRRFTLPVTVARLHLGHGEARAEIVPLLGPARPAHRRAV
jgi:uncharacterized protein